MTGTDTDLTKALFPCRVDQNPYLARPGASSIDARLANLDGLTFDTYPGLSLRWIVGNQTMRCDNCLTPNEWQHVAATVDTTGAMHIYRNGKLLKVNEFPVNDAGKLVTSGYTLQRWGKRLRWARAIFPIKFNGLHFCRGPCRW